MPEKSNKKCVRIEMEYSNGEVWQATGVDAAAICEHYESLEFLGYTHGAGYAGPVMKKVEGSHIS